MRCIIEVGQSHNTDTILLFTESFHRQYYWEANEFRVISLTIIISILSIFEINNTILSISLLPFHWWDIIAYITVIWLSSFHCYYLYCHAIEILSFGWLLISFCHEAQFTFHCHFRHYAIIAIYFTISSIYLILFRFADALRLYRLDCHYWVISLPLPLASIISFH